MAKTYWVTRRYKVTVPDGADYSSLVAYFKEDNPEFFEEEGITAELIDQQIPHWITHAYDRGDLTDLVTDVDSHLKEVKHAE